MIYGSYSIRQASFRGVVTVMQLCSLVTRYLLREFVICVRLTIKALRIYANMI